MSEVMPGRNEPCPCGSGVKFKRCCGSDDRWVPGLGWVPTFARRRATEGRMIADAVADPALLEASAWSTFCEAERAGERGEPDVMLAGWQAVFQEPARHPWIGYAELSDSIAQAYIALERWDMAIEWFEREVALRRDEHGEADAWGCRRDIAEVLIRAGRADEAKRIYEENRAATPDDIWLYNGAALAWLYSGHDAAGALPWIEEGLALAKRTGDPEHVLEQLQDLRREALGD